MTRAQETAVRLRWFLAAVWVLCLGLGLLWLIGTTFFDLGEYGVGLGGSPSWIILGPLASLLEEDLLVKVVPLVVYLGLFVFTQWLFLCPKGGWKIKIEETGRSMKRSAAAAGFAAALLSAGLLYSLYDLIGTLSGDGVVLWLFMVIPAVLWCVWFAIFWVYWRQGDYYTWMGRMIRGLIGGSVLELFVAIPVYATRQDDCYCARGSYAGVIFGGTVLVWAFGPGVLFLFAREKERRKKLANIGDR